MPYFVILLSLNQWLTLLENIVWRLKTSFKETVRRQKLKRQNKTAHKYLRLLFLFSVVEDFVMVANHIQPSKAAEEMDNLTRVYDTLKMHWGIEVEGSSYLSVDLLFNLWDSDSENNFLIYVSFVRKSQNYCKIYSKSKMLHKSSVAIVSKLIFTVCLMLFSSIRTLLAVTFYTNLSLSFQKMIYSF